MSYNNLRWLADSLIYIYMDEGEKLDPAPVIYGYINYSIVYVHRIGFNLFDRPVVKLI